MRFMKTPTQGAATSIYLASSPDVQGITGQYIANSTPKASNRTSYDTTAANRLWQVSADLVGHTAAQPQVKPGLAPGAGCGTGADPRAPHRASPVSTAPAFDPAVFGGDPQTPTVSMVICWYELDPAGYARTLRDLADWIDWFRRTYRVPATVIPPCWLTHPGLREDLGHL